MSAELVGEEIHSMTDDIRGDLKHLQREVKRLEDVMEKLRDRTISARVWDYLMKLSIPMVLLTGGTVIAHEVSLSKIESNRFTAADGHALERHMEAASQRYVAESEARLTKAISAMPPEWLRDLVTELKAGQKDILTRLTKVETRLENGNGK